jgi:hemerythrin
MATWNDNLALGIERVDQQHRELLQELDNLQLCVRKGEGSKAALPTLRFLIEYASKHFSEEETLMQTHEYPALPEHRAMHAQFREDCLNLLHRLSDETQATKLSIDLCFRLTEWLYSHISKVDREMGNYLATRGVR